jgi:hypothetical protein
MQRCLLLSLCLVLLGLGICACGSAYTVPSRGIAADISGTQGTGSASLGRSWGTLDFRDSDLSRR